MQMIQILKRKYLMTEMQMIDPLDRILEIQNTINDLCFSLLFRTLRDWICLPNLPPVTICCAIIAVECALGPT